MSMRLKTRFECRKQRDHGLSSDFQAHQHWTEVELSQQNLYRLSEPKCTRQEPERHETTAVGIESGASCNESKLCCPRSFQNQRSTMSAKGVFLRRPDTRQIWFAACRAIGPA